MTSALSQLTLLVMNFAVHDLCHDVHGHDDLCHYGLSRMTSAAMALVMTTSAVKAMVEMTMSTLENLISLVKLA